VHHCNPVALLALPNLSQTYSKLRPRPWRNNTLASFNLSALPPPPCAEAGETGTGGGAAAAGRGAGLVPGAAGQGRALRRFTYDALSAWTENFSKRLGTGGLGSVYLRLARVGDEDCSQEAGRCGGGRE